ncbi:hypothetical protein QUF74_00065 [Candidatus Halobeggiatoa sp. HSG11]|nr:hypothetical protein [Candidatus Halobeggiatoa sp. HSG11]
MYYSKIAKILTLLPVMLICITLTVQADGDLSADSHPVDDTNTTEESVDDTKCSNTPIEGDENTESSDTSTEENTESSNISIEDGDDTDPSDTSIEENNAAECVEEPQFFEGEGGYELEIPIPLPDKYDVTDDEIDPPDPVKNKEHFDPKSWALYLDVQEAIKKGGEFTGPAAVNWHRHYRCSGCHIQTQSLMGMALSIKKDAEIDQKAANFLYNTVGASGHENGSLWISHSYRQKSQTALGLWSLTGWPDKEFSFLTKYNAAKYFHNQRKQTKTNHWYADSGHYWWGNDIAQTALVTIGMADVLKTAPTLQNQQEYRLLETADLGSGGEVRDIEQHNGSLYVLKVNGQVNRINMATGQTTTFVTRLPNNSTGLAVANDGTLYISGNNGRLIQAQQDNWQYVGNKYYGTIRDVEIGPDNNLYLSDQKYHRILTVSLNGIIISSKNGSGLSKPTGLTFDSKGNLYIANYSGYNILKLDTEGTVTTFADGLPFPPMWLDANSKDELFVSAKNFSYEGHTPYGIYRINQNGIAQRILSGQKIFGIVQANGKTWAANATTDKLNEINPIPLDMQLLPKFEKDVKAAVGYFMKNYRDNSSDKTVHALRLMALGEARLALTDNTVLAKIDRAIYAEEQWLRKRQNDNGGWGRYNNQASDALVTSMVGLGLEYSNPMKDDLMVRKAVMYLLETQANNGSWKNRNNGLSTRLAATSFVMAYLPKALERLRPLSDEEFNEILAKTSTASCKFYALNDKNKNHSQLLIFSPDNRMENFVVNKVGRTLKGFDLEGLAIHPITKIIYTTSGDDAGLGKFPGYLYVIDAKTGKITLPIGSTGFEEVDSIIFAPNGTLYGWAKGEGLITIDIRTGEGTLVLPSDRQVEDLALSKEIILYGAENTNLLKYQPDTNSLEVQCNNLPGETESLEALTNNLLLLGTHKGELLQVFNIEECQVESAIRIPTGNFKDIEGIGVIAEECPLGDLVETAIELMDTEPDKQICLPLEHFDIGQSIEGSDIMYPGLTFMTSSGKSKIIAEGEEPAIYEADGKINGCIDRGIADTKRYHNYTFWFDSGLTVNDFSLQISDFGDLNPIEDSDEEANSDDDLSQTEEPNPILQHSVSLKGYNAQENLVAKDTLNYTTEAGVAYRDDEFFGTGDACQDELGQLGNYPFNITGSGISKVKLKFKNSEISDPEFAISNICFTLERLPTNLLRFLPRNYVNEHIGDFIDGLQHDRINKFSEQYIIDNLVRLQSQFFRDYVDGLPSKIIQDFFAEELQENIEIGYPKRLVDDILEEFPQEFQDKLTAEFPLLFLDQPQLDDEDKLMDHLEHTRSSLIERHQYLEKFMPHFGGQVPVDLLRNILSDEAGDMFAGILTVLVKESNSKDSLVDILEILPDFIVNKLLDKQDDE